jgi:hypothetical protein
MLRADAHQARQQQQQQHDKQQHQLQLQQQQQGQHYQQQQLQAQRHRQQQQQQQRYETSRAASPGGDSVLTVRVSGHQQQQQQHSQRYDTPIRTSDASSRQGSNSNGQDYSSSDNAHNDAHGLNNLNRWSTTSSIASIDVPPSAIEHSQQSTRRASEQSNHHGFGHQSAGIWAHRRVSAAEMSPEDVSPRSNLKTRPVDMESPEYNRRRMSRLGMPNTSSMSISNTHSPNDEPALLTATTFSPSSTGLLTPNDYANLEYSGSNTSSSYEKSPHVLPPRTSSRVPTTNDTDSGRVRDKKTMLSKALEKANTAVLLDNAMNYEGALESYLDACRLLELVLDRTSTIDDRRKLDAIRDTYTVRINELLQIQVNPHAAAWDKQLPPRPMSNGSAESASSNPRSVVIETATMTAPPTGQPSPMEPPSSFLDAHGPRTSFLTSAIHEIEGNSAPGAFLGPLWERERSRSPFRDSTISHDTARPYATVEPALVPRPLTSRSPDEYDESYDLESRPVTADSQESQKSADPVSWLDTINESGSSGSPSDTTTSTRSPSPSIHSGSPDLHRRGISIALSHASMNFDAAFDAAVEAAYEDGYEEFPTGLSQPQDDTPDLDLEVPLPPSDQYHMFGHAHLDDEEEEAEEERILAEITNNYKDHGFNFDIQSKSALPRESDSSTYSNRTRQSSQVSNRTTAGTSLSTVAEDSVSQMPRKEVLHTPSSSLATDISRTSPEQDSGAQQDSTPARRAPNITNFKQLKIETRRPTLRSRGYTNTEPKEANGNLTAEDELDPDRRISEVPSLRRVEAALASPYQMRSAASDSMRTMSMESLVPDSADLLSSNFRSPRPRLMRGRTKSSLSLRDGGFVSEETDTAPASPMSALPSGGEAPPPFRRHITSNGGVVSISRTGSASGGHHIFEAFLSSPYQPPSPGADDSCSPSSLEPCPEPTILRPFWMLRCIAGVVNQPRGGFLTTRIFVPRQVWLNRSVKLKGIEDKIANCDLLTAALGKLSKVDTYDADAVLAELQGFEEVMERVQTMLIKRLGSEVGVQGTGALFKDAPVSIDSAGTTAESREPKPNKSYLSSWRKLRGKNTTGTSVTIPISSTRTEKDVPTMASVPMTDFVSVEKRTNRYPTPKESSFNGPHKEYMSSVSRLCEAAQVLDHIARQVEDPGLKHSSSTHIGLELSTRHAAEFFGFYVCRFLLGDLTLLVDKYVKRSSEWIAV